MSRSLPKGWEVKELYQPLAWRMFNINVDIGQGSFAQWLEACTPQKEINLKKYRLKLSKEDGRYGTNKRGFFCLNPLLEGVDFQQFLGLERGSPVTS